MIKKPLIDYDGTIKELGINDSLEAGLFEIDIDGGMMPITSTSTDNYYELDGNDDIQPLP